MQYYIMFYVFAGVLTGIGMFSENAWRMEQSPRMNLFTLICGCLFLGLVWPITFIVKVMLFLHCIIM